MDRFLKTLVVLFVCSTALMSTVFVFVTIIPETKNTLDSDSTLVTDYCQDWCDYEELDKMGCDQPILEHLAKHSNLLDEEFNGKYEMEDIGLSDGVSVEKFNDCVDGIYEKRVSDEFDRTWGGPGNRHPAFLGYDIPKICTEDMIKHLVKYSTMFERDVPYGLDWIGLGASIDPDDFDMCVEELLERNPRD